MGDNIFGSSQPQGSGSQSRQPWENQGTQASQGAQESQPSQASQVSGFQGLGTQESQGSGSQSSAPQGSVSSSYQTFGASYQRAQTPGAQGRESAPNFSWAHESSSTSAGTQGSAYGQTARRPPVPGQYDPSSSSQHSGSQSATQTHQDFSSAGSSGAPVPPNFSDKPKKKAKGGHSTLKTLLIGLLGGLLGTGALVGSLVLAGVIGPVTTTQLVSTDGVQEITIDPNDEDITVANAVAAKALPSVCTVYCTFPDGSGMGSGVIYDTEGNIITNNHVIEDAQSISVTYNGKSYEATLVGTDPSSDVAVIHADFGGDSVTPMEIGDSSDLQVGDWVMSVGSPFGLENSVSQGIVSALSRSTLLENSTGNTLYTNLIQTDATINPGNSGGALVDDEGKLVGICTLFSSDTESFAGIGYAIPGNYATQVADKIIAGETVTHAYIGLTMQTVNAQNATRNGLSVDSGAYVIEVAEDGPAEAAGIKAGDVIIGIGGEQIDSADAAILAVRSHEIGDTVEVTVMRGDEEKTFEVTLSSDEALQEEQDRQEQQRQETVDINGQDISIDDLIELYEQYQNQDRPPL